MARRFLNIDDDLLTVARAELETETVADTVNAALRSVVADRAAVVRQAIQALADTDLAPRDQAWR